MPVQVATRISRPHRTAHPPTPCSRRRRRGHACACPAAFGPTAPRQLRRRLGNSPHLGQSESMLQHSPPEKAVSRPEFCSPLMSPPATHYRSKHICALFTQHVLSTNRILAYAQFVFVCASWVAGCVERDLGRVSRARFQHWLRWAAADPQKPSRRRRSSHLPLGARPSRRA